MTNVKNTLVLSEVTEGLSAFPSFVRLGEMVTSNNQWAQADAIGCLGWLVTAMPSEKLHELIPVVTGIMVKSIELDEGNLIPQGRQEPEPREGTAGRVDRRVEPGERDGRVLCELKGEAMENAARDVARERMDNLRVYSLIFLLKASERTLPSVDCLP